MPETLVSLKIKKCTIGDMSGTLSPSLLVAERQHLDDQWLHFDRHEKLPVQRDQGDQFQNLELEVVLVEHLHVDLLEYLLL